MDAEPLISLIVTGVSLLGIGVTVLYTDHKHRQAMRK